jgi:hypothetical protein
MGHSTGYQAYLGNQVHPQIPWGWDDALSDEPFEFSNNHGRLFGPYEASGGYVLVGAFSREEVDPFQWPGHQYASFNKARDDFAKRIDAGQYYRLLGFVSLTMPSSTTAWFQLAITTERPSCLRLSDNRLCRAPPQSSMKVREPRQTARLEPHADADHGSVLEHVELVAAATLALNIVHVESLVAEHA